MLQINRACALSIVLALSAACSNNNSNSGPNDAPVNPSCSLSSKSLEANVGQMDASIAYRGATASGTAYIGTDGTIAYEVNQLNDDGAQVIHLKLNQAGALSCTQSDGEGHITYAIAGARYQPTFCTTVNFASSDVTWSLSTLSPLSSDYSAHYIEATVQPGASVSDVYFTVEGADAVTVNSGGDLVMQVGERTLTLAAPTCSQEKEQKQCGYQVTGNRVSFDVPMYDATKALLIDPVVTLSDEASLCGDGNSIVNSVDATSGSQVWVGGWTKAKNFLPSPGVSIPDNSTYGFVSEYDLNGELKQTFVIGGQTGTQTAIASVAYDAKNKNVVIGGHTQSATEFPKISAQSAQPCFGEPKTTISSCKKTASSSYYNGFVGRYDPSTSTLLANTYIGGSAFTGISQVAVDKTGKVYVVGSTLAPDLPAINSQSYMACLHGNGTLGSCTDDKANKEADGFLIALNSELSGFVGGTYWGTTQGATQARGVAVDDAGPLNTLVFISGDQKVRSGAKSPVNFPPNATQSAYVVKFESTANSLELQWSAYVGGNNTTTNAGIALQKSKLFAAYPYIVGTTTATNLVPASLVAKAYQSTLQGTQSVYIAKINNNGKSLLYMTYLGGSDVQQAVGANSIAVDKDGLAYVTGVSKSTNFPLVNASGLASPNNPWGFVVKTQSADSAKDLAYSTPLFTRSAVSNAGIGVSVPAAQSNPTAFVVGAFGPFNFTTQPAFNVPDQIVNGFVIQVKQ